MLLDIVSIANRGNAAKELVHLHARESCNLDHFLLMDSTFKSLQYSNQLRHVYWWSSGQIARKGDDVFVFTGTGTNTSFINANGTRSWLYFWNLKMPIWNDAGDKGVLCQLSDWQVKSALAG